MTTVETAAQAPFRPMKASAILAIATIAFLIAALVAQSRYIDRQETEILKGRDDRGYGFASGFLDACGYPCIIRENHGGALTDFQMLGALVLVRKVPVIIDGPCASACALFADIARQYVQITKAASFHFHKTSAEEDPPQSPEIARWVKSHGGFPAFASNCLTPMPFEEARRFWRPFFDWYAIPRQINPLTPWLGFDPLGLISKREALPRFDMVAERPMVTLRGSMR